MPDTKHSPGPWWLMRTRLGIFVNSDGHPLATVRSAPYRASEDEPNAKLIAAAPTMLDTLEKVRDSLRDMAMTLRLLAQRLGGILRCDPRQR